MSWIQTYTGKKFYPLDAKTEDIDILDIARALSMQCRYAGHVAWHYSVAQHSVLIAQNVHPKNALWGLLHDATEAYLLDIPRPLKRKMPAYRRAEQKLMDLIAFKFKLSSIFSVPAEVKDLDRRICFDERAALLLNTFEWDDMGEPNPLGIAIHKWTPEQAEVRFLDAFRQITAPGFVGL